MKLGFLRPSAPDLHSDGLYVPQVPWQVFQNLALTAGRLYLTRFVPVRPMAATGIKFSVGTAAGANDNVDVGIYNSTLTTVLASSGSTAGKLNGTGVQTVNFTATVSLTTGTVYYAAFAVVTPFGGTAANLRAALLNANDMAQLFGTAEPHMEAGTQTAFPISGSAAGMTVASSVPLLVVKG